MTSKEALNKIQHHINGTELSGKELLECYEKIDKDLERLEELENDRLLDRAEKEELERVNAVLNHNLEEKVEIIFELENKIQELKADVDGWKTVAEDYEKHLKNYSKENRKLKQDLEVLEALKQRWKQEEWCQGIELSAESLNSLFKYNEELFDKNLELDRKLEAEFEDSADAICKALAERDKLLDENIELQQEIQDLKEEINELSKDELCFEKRCDKLEKAIELLKEKFVIKFEFIPKYNYVRVCIQDSVDEISFVINLDTHKEQYDSLKEVFGNE